MSDTSLSDAIPTDSELEKGLRTAVCDAFKRGDRDSITVKRLRTAAEAKLGLDDGFFKENPSWKERSKEIIQAEVDAKGQDDPPSSNPVTQRHSNAKRSSTIAEQSEAPPKSKKRKSDDPPQPKPRKKRKSVSDDEPDSDADGVKQASARSKNKAKTVRSNKQSRKIMSVEVDEAVTNGEDSGASESEMSVVLDEEPKPKKKNRLSSDGKSKSKKSESAKSKKSADSSADPDAEEIKRLQGWLVKCGIRKMWYKELAPYDTPNLKIRHLKEMLADAGMTGRFSKEKADQIRDQRELQADLEAVQEGEKTWGKSNSEDGKSDSDKQPRRRLARGLQGLDFLNDSDGEETD